MAAGITARPRSRLDRIDEAFEKYKRADFLPAYIKNMATADMALPIGYGQTISQPTTVRMMLEWLEVEPGDKVLDIGSGSGWTTALLAHLTGASGQVYAVERLPELLEFGRDNAEQAGVSNAGFYQAGDQYGLPEHGPYDRILVSATADRLPPELLDQLKPGGKLVIPIHQTILEIIKNQKSEIATTEHPGFIFVPLI